MAVLLAGAIEFWLWPEVDGHPFLIFFAPIILAAMLFDRGNGFLAATASAAVVDFLFLEPRYSFLVAGTRNVLALLFFTVVGLAIATIIEAMHVAVHKLHDTNAELARSDAKKNLLLREAAHRMRNDLQMIGGLVEIQQRAVREPAAQAALASTADRIRLLGRVQQRLRGSDETLVVDAREFITELCDDLKATLLALRPIRLKVDVEPHRLSQERAVAVGLIINELLTNALKYAFPDERSGNVRVSFAMHGDDYSLSVADDGIGIAAGDVPPPGDGAGGLGQRIVRTMAAQLGGTYEIQQNDATDGTIAIVRFPVNS